MAPGAVQREHQLSAQALPRRILRHQSLELRDQPGVPSEGQVGLDPILDRAEAQLREPGYLVAGEVLVGEVGERLTAPQLERGPELLGRPGGIAAVECLASLVREPFEPVGVDLIRAYVKRVSPAAGYEDALAQHPAQARDIDLHGLRGGVGRPVTPQLIDNSVHRNDRATVDEQDSEHGALPAASKRLLVPVNHDLKRAQNAKVH